ncbi:MAG: cupredoxin domain-containing protein [Terriglobales bacterium]
MRRRLFLTLAALAAFACAQTGVRGAVTVEHLAGRKADSAGVVVWLTPRSADVAAATATPAPLQHFRMAQRNRHFAPSLLVIPAGATVDFPNFDPYFHNVFSLGQGHPFDLGLYQAGASRAHRFIQPGVNYVFCNIHSQMTAVIVTVPSYWYAVSNAAGDYALPPAPPGAYQLHVWYERAAPAALAQLTRTLTVPSSGALTLPPFTIAEVAAPATHTNKYGKPYAKTKAYGLGGGL